MEIMNGFKNANASDWVKLLLLMQAVKDGRLDEEDKLTKPLSFLDEIEIRELWDEIGDWFVDTVDDFIFMKKGVTFPQLSCYKTDFPHPFPTDTPKNKILSHRRGVTVAANTMVTWVVHEYERERNEDFPDETPLFEQENPFWEERGGAMFVKFHISTVVIPVMTIDGIPFNVIS
jgi:hypothetical protein